MRLLALLPLTLTLASATRVYLPCSEPGVIEGPDCGSYSACIADPRKDGAGICIGNAQPMCGGFAGKKCDDGMECVDNPFDDCNRQSGGADCAGYCV